MLTTDMVKLALPATLRASVTQQLVDKINNFTNDPVVAENIRDNFLSYSKILSEGKFKTEDYLKAIAYVSFKHMGYSNQDAYFKTFPDRHAALMAKQANQKDIASYVSMYAKGKLVNLILEQSLIPVWLLNQDAYQRAINTQVEIMETSQSDMARTAAANSILTHLAKPKEAANTINLNLPDSSGMKELKGMLSELVHTQRKAIEQGVSPRDIAGQRIIDVDSEDVTDGPGKTGS
jgi:hypothetical protein